MDERAFLEYVARQPGCFVSRAYAGLSLSGYKGDKIKEALLAKGLLLQQETRQGEGGRVAKTLSLTEKGVALLTETLAALSGKGGSTHKRLQAMIKEQAELLAWQATIEERIIEGSGQVDVGLEKDEMKVAVEVSVTTDSDCQGRRKTRPEGRRKNRPLPVREGVDLLDRAGVAGAEACASVQAARLGRSGRHPSPIVATCGEG